MKMKKLSRPLLALAATACVALAGCGGDDSTPVATTPPPVVTPPVVVPPVVTVDVSGVVADGLLQNAKVCLDVNANRLCDAAEPTTMTDAKGAYTLKATVGQTDFTVLALAMKDVTVDAAYGPVSANFTLMAPAGKGAFISPYTTLLQSELDSGRAANLPEAESTVLAGMVGTAGAVGGLNLYSDYTDVVTATPTTAQLRMYGAAQVLAKGFADTEATGLTGTALSAALGQGVTGSMKHVLTQVAGTLTLANRDIIANAIKESLVPTTATLASIARARANTTPAPIEGAWIRTTGAQQEVFIFVGDGTFIQQTVKTAVATTSTFDNGFGYRYGRYTLADGNLTTTLIEAAGQSGPGNETVAATISGDTMTLGATTLNRLKSPTNPLVGGWLRPNGSDKPQYLLFLDDTTYVHSTFYREDDFETGTATFLETARTVGLQKGQYTVTTTNAISVIDFGTITTAPLSFATGGSSAVDFNGTLSIPGNPGVAVIQDDGSVAMEGARFVKLGTPLGATVVSGFSETTRSRVWSGRYFSRTISGVLQYIYVRGPNDVITFNQMPTGSDVTAACTPLAVGPAPLAPFSSIDPADGLLKQFVVGTSTNVSAGFAQRRMNVGTPASFVTYTPIARPSNATARCALPL
ncbi:MAG: hypothetical protein EOO28_32050 [Comamonadaceae bacterium]|nr:MAG: hypothetical protein EOO28_32050 [Comamonadaceae bacterium]